jgi:hypothetical protein
MVNAEESSVGDRLLKNCGRLVPTSRIVQTHTSVVGYGAREAHGDSAFFHLCFVPPVGG